MPGRWLAAKTGANGWPGVRFVIVILYFTKPPAQLLAAASMEAESKHPTNKDVDFFIICLLWRILINKM
jgi:hypothetical protein